MTEVAGQATHSGARLLAASAVSLLPLAGLGLLIGRPEFDVSWEHHPAHFWLVLAAAALSATVAYGTGAAALRRGDARVLLVSLAFLAAAGFLGLHALATPGVLLATPNAGFVLATPVGLALGSVFAAMSTADFADRRGVGMVRWGKAVRLALLAVMGLWAVASIAQLPPLQQPAAPERATGILAAIAVPAVALYAASAYRYLQMSLRRPSLMLTSMMAAFVLLAEALVALVVARDWHLSWWEWHVLMLAAFGLVAIGARVQWHEERFADLYLADTVTGSRDITVLFADLQGFTAFSERHDPAEVTAMLNAYFEVAIPPVVKTFRGEVDRIIGDALMVTFNKRGDQPDHARRAAEAGLALQASTQLVAERHPGWPRFRVGVNSGPVSVSLLGTAGGRTHTVIGDTVNIASRIEGLAPAGSVAIGPGTKVLLTGAETRSLGFVQLKGKTAPVEAHLLISL